MVHQRVSAVEQWERRATIRSNLASQRMEGHEPDAQALQDCEKWVRGETTIKESALNNSAFSIRRVGGHQVLRPVQR
ncbi:antitoxin VbhA family protein [Acidovorax sp. NCPPB 3576]|uniref:antitoxin VbhA family protein n=1 Tax=Acidovorax sp. NCPPB 3576 TaxID=2940488 RepID=UPI003FA489E2